MIMFTDAMFYGNPCLEADECREKLGVHTYVITPDRGQFLPYASCIAGNIGHLFTFDTKRDRFEQTQQIEQAIFAALAQVCTKLEMPNPDYCLTETLCPFDSRICLEMKAVNVPDCLDVRTRKMTANEALLAFQD